MGSNNHLVLFGPTQQQVAAAVTEREAAISPTVNGFTLVVDQEFASFDAKRILNFATSVSRTLICPAILVSQGDVLSYSLIKGGTVVDEYNSEPDYHDFEFKHVPPRGPQGGDADRLCALLGRAGARAQIDRILHSQDAALDASARYMELVEALWMPKFSVGFGVGVLHDNYPEGLDETGVLLTTSAREYREIEMKSKQPRQLKSEDATLPSGKRIWRKFELDGGLVEEHHRYGDAKGRLAIGIKRIFAHGRKTGEIYFHNKRLVSRDVYERERAQYPDMPAPDLSVRDTGAEGLEELALNQEALQEQAKGDRNPATGKDAFCLKVMSRGRHADASEWVQSENHTVGEMDSAGSRALIAKFVELGAVSIHVCNIYSSPDGRESSGRLVVELPKASPARAALLRAIRPFARQHGSSGDVDDGQQYAYVRVGA